jgi:hypothetical protein
MMDFNEGEHILQYKPLLAILNEISLEWYNISYVFKPKKIDYPLELLHPQLKFTF